MSAIYSKVSQYKQTKNKARERMINKFSKILAREFV